ncbi:MAG: hypothetical protein KF863_21590 [Rubrivivax sp.]|nr:hypothetical protein [Rubrivivax sp.]
MTDWKAKEAALSVAVRALIARFPYLVTVSHVNGRDGLNCAAKNMRIELARAFPGVKFSVRSRRFSGGDAIDVSWVDGPTSQQVDEIIDRYSAGSFNGMEDIYEYRGDRAWVAAFGDAKYVNSQRSSSDKAIASAIRTVFARYAGNLDGIEQPTVEAYRSGGLRSVRVPHLGDELGDLISREVSRRTWALNKAPTVQAELLEAA